MIYKEYQDIPEDWSLVRLDQIAEINPRKSKKVLQNGELVDVTPETSVTFLAMKDVSESAKILNRQDKLYAEVEKGYTSFKEEDILVAKITPCFENGKGAWAKGLSNGIGFGTTEFHVIRPNEEINKKWLNYITSSYYFRKRGELNMQGSAGQKRIPTDFVKSYRLPKPPKNEQDQIAKTISTCEETISKTEKLINAKKRYKKGLMQRLLSGRVRFPEFEGEDWVEVKLGEVFDRVTEKNETELVKNVLTISAQDGLVSQTDYYNKSVASKDLSNYIVLNRGEFAYNKSYSEGYPLGAIKRLDDYEQGVLSPLYICFKLTSDKVDSDFITHFFEYGGLNHGIYKIAREGARNHGLLNVSVKDFFEIDLKLPSRKEQVKIAMLLNEASKEIELLETQLDKYKNQKKGLMQQLLTGKVRVN